MCIPRYVFTINCIKYSGFSLKIIYCFSTYQKICNAWRVKPVIECIQNTMQENILDVINELKNEWYIENEWFSSQACYIFIYICSSVTGILFAILCIEAQKRNFFSLLDSKSYLLKSNFMMLIFGLSSVLGIADTAIFLLTCDSKIECLRVHPFITFVPVSFNKFKSI